MKNQVLERQADGTYRLSEEPQANLEQEKTGDARSILSKLGMSDAEIANILGTETPAANLESSIPFLDKITGIEIAGIPVGSAAIGAAITILADRFVIAKLDPQQKWGIWANIGLAFVIKKWAGKFIGDKTADVTALFLTYEAVADYVTQMINKVFPPTVAAQQAVVHQSGVLQQANRVASDYYARAFGG